MLGTVLWGALAMAVPLALLARLFKTIHQIGPHFAKRFAGARPKDIVIAGGIIAALVAFLFWNGARVSAQRWAVIEQVLGLPAGLETGRYRPNGRSSLALPRGAGQSTLTDRQASDLLARIANRSAIASTLRDFNGSAVERVSADALRWQSFDDLKGDRAQLVPWMRLTADPARRLAGSHIVCIAFVPHDGKVSSRAPADKRFVAKSCSDRAPREAYEFIVIAALESDTRTLHVAVL